MKMKTLPLSVFFFFFFSIFGFCQDAENKSGHFHVVVSKFEYGINSEDSTTIWSDSTLSTTTIIDIFKDSLIYCTGNDFETFHFLSPLPTNHIDIKSYESINRLSKKLFVITYFTSDFDEKMMTVIIDTPKISRNFYGSFLHD